jgi:hypothetical protein
MFKIVSCVFSLLFVGSIAVAGGSPTASSAVPAASASIPQVCSDQKAACTADCHDLFGNALSGCLRACSKEYQECIAGHQTLTGVHAGVNRIGR